MAPAHRADDLIGGRTLLPRLFDYVPYWAARIPDREAAIDAHVRITWSELKRRVDRCAAALVDAGVRHGDRVALHGHPSADMLVVLLATAGIGGVFMGLNPRYTAGELRYVLADATPRVVLADARDVGQLPTDGLAAELTVLAVTDVVSPTATASPQALEALPQLRAGVDRLDPCLLVHTSGTTGRPKGALLPHAGLVSCSSVQADRWYDADGPILCNLPVNHVGCLGDICASTVVAGGTVVFQPHFDAAGVLDLIAKERIAYWGAVPAMFALSVRTPQWATADLSSLHRIIWSGGAMPLQLGQQLLERCPRLATSYGMTETVGSVTYTDEGADLETLCATVGRPDPHFEVRIARPDGSTCPPGEEGELLVRGDCLMLGYLGRPDATAEAIDPDGWLHTGDIAVERPDGNLVLTGRTKDLFKSGGYNVYPREVEAGLEEHPAVVLAAVLGVPDGTYGEVGHAFVVLTPDGVRQGVDGEQLRRFARDRLANYKVPKRVTVTTALPLLPVGKVDKESLRASVGAGAGPAPPAATATAEVRT